ncbi:MAG: hypothetical protein D6734_03645, partial [Candidatus Schekmanbacteria bacterium]
MDLNILPKEINIQEDNPAKTEAPLAKKKTSKLSKRENKNASENVKKASNFQKEINKIIHKKKADSNNETDSNTNESPEE